MQGRDQFICFYGAALLFLFHVLRNRMSDTAVRKPPVNVWSMVLRSHSECFESQCQVRLEMG
jgi:hypothetical protein